MNGSVLWFHNYKTLGQCAVLNQEELWFWNMLSLLRDLLYNRFDDQSNVFKFKLIYLVPGVMLSHADNMPHHLW